MLDFEHLWYNVIIGFKMKLALLLPSYPDKKKHSMFLSFLDFFFMTLLSLFLLSCCLCA